MQVFTNFCKSQIKSLRQQIEISVKMKEAKQKVTFSSKSLLYARNAFSRNLLFGRLMILL